MTRYSLINRADLDFSIDYDEGQIMTQYYGALTCTPFKAAFAKAIDCLISLEDGTATDLQPQLYMIAYGHYLANAPAPPA